MVRNTHVTSLISKEAREIIGDRMQNYRISYPKYLLETPIEPKTDQCCQNYCKNCVYTFHAIQVARFSEFVDEHAHYIDMDHNGNLVVSSLSLYNKFRNVIKL
jgi:hypothetical protein